MDWQEQIIRDLFGIIKPNGYRQFNTAYIEIPKKNGKSELAAAVALLLCCGDEEQRAEIYGCAADRGQATIVFDVAADMVRMCPALNRRCKILASQKRILYTPTNSFYQVLSAEAYSKHGFNIHGVVFDELHTQPNRKLFDVMTKGSGDARMQPLYFLITTAGTDTNSICYETHRKAVDILEGRKIDPTFYPVIYGAGQEEDWTDPKVWKKANPCDKLLMVIKKDYDDTRKKAFLHIEIETLPYCPTGEANSPCITTFLHGMYYPEDDVFTHIDYTKNQYIYSDYEQKYADANPEIPIDFYAEKKLHYKIWCIENGTYSREIWYKLMVASLPKKYHILLDEILA